MENDSNGLSKRILHIEEWSEATNFFVQELHTGTGCSIEHAGTFDQGRRKIEQGHGSVDIVLYTVNPASTDVLLFPEQVKSMAEEALFRCPQFIILASSPLALPCAARCIDRQMFYLLRDYPKQIVETVRAMLWKIRTSKSGPTIRVTFSGGHYRFFLCAQTSAEEIVVSAQIGRLLLLLLRGTCTVEMLADRLEISRQSVKKYMHELRVVIESILRTLDMPVTAAVWMERHAGGTLCGLRLNAVWD